jgi:hypothetical protein
VSARQRRPVVFDIEPLLVIDKGVSSMRATTKPPVPHLSKSTRRLLWRLNYDATKAKP